MTAIPPPLHETVAAIFAAYEQRAGDGFRSHLGASEIGHECDRYLWLQFRWAEPAKFPGLVLRKFQTGELEEPRIFDNLRWIGCEVHTHDGAGKQFKVSAVHGHFGGSMDGVVLGLPEAPKSWHVLECKALNAKTWADIAKRGVRLAAPRYWAQVQIYMHLEKLERAAFIAVNKDTDEIYLERVEHDAEEAERLIERARRLISSPVPPTRLSDDPAWYQCKWCKFHSQCHGTAAPAVNCRTCVHSTPDMREGSNTGLWLCEWWNRIGLPVQHQREGCPEHRFVPAMLERFADPLDAHKPANKVIYLNRFTNVTFVNGNGRHHLTSKEIRATADKKMLGQERADPELRKLRREFNGRNCG